MKIGVLGSGMVGQAIAGKLVSLGHEVTVGTRDPHKLDEWLASVGGKARIGSFADAAAGGEIVFNATAGMGTLNALAMAGAGNLAGKVLVDISNPLDFSQGMPPSLFVSNTDSLAEQIQRAFPETKVVKTLSTMNANVMVNPQLVAGGDHTIFVSGDDAAAKAQVETILRDGFGWQDIVDLGDIKTARAVEMAVPLWVAVLMRTGSPMFQFKVVK
jgi:hypothetical protein